MRNQRWDRGLIELTLLLEEGAASRLLREIALTGPLPGRRRFPLRLRSKFTAEVGNHLTLHRARLDDPRRYVLALEQSSVEFPWDLSPLLHSPRKFPRTNGNRDSVRWVHRNALPSFLRRHPDNI